ncbi:MAG: capsular polysaccharide synthesis protein [Moraxella sp.]
MHTIKEKNIKELSIIINDFEKETKELEKIKFYKQKIIKNFYRIFIPKEKRLLMEKNADVCQQKHLYECWKALAKLYFNNDLPEITIKSKKNFPTQKIIWQYWGQGINNNIPEIVQTCFDSVDKFKNDYAIIRLDDETVADYIEFPDFIWKKRKNHQFKHAFFADLLRLTLLYLYGGIWIDATVLLTNQIDDRILNQDFFMFQRDFNCQNRDFWRGINANYFEWSNDHHINVLNSFIVSRKSNNITKDCLQLLLNFWKNQNNITHYFFFQIMFDLLLKEYIKDANLLIIDDTLPHLLFSKIDKEFINQEYNEILLKSNIHKLTYIKSSILSSSIWYGEIKNLIYH